MVLSEVKTKTKKLKLCFAVLPWNIGGKPVGYVWFSAWHRSPHSKQLQFLI